MKIKWKLGRPAVPPMAVWIALIAMLTVILSGLVVKQIKRHPGPPPSAAENVEPPPSKASTGTDSLTEDPSMIIPVYLSKEKRIDKVTLEDYVRGVVAGEMPIDFELEALKAQALAARTYMIRRLAEQDFSGVPDKEAWVTDTVSHQAYLTLDYLKTRWTGEAYERNMDKLNRAVNETRGMVLTYEGKPINATFFSTGNGYTENSEDYWGVYVPYLRSVKSPWDEASPEYRTTAVFSLKEFASRLGLPSTVSAASAGNGFKVQGYTEGHRVSKATVAGRTFSGREIREKLGLRSSQFQWKVKGTNIEFTTFGYGHGVGMSQWGANAMAKEGRTAEEIVKYYYTGISLEKDSAYLTMK